MKKIIIKDYYDFNYPSELISEGNLAFLGTGKIMADLIEKQGLIAGVKPYEISDIQFLIESYQKLGYGKHVMPKIDPEISDKPHYSTGYWDLSTYAIAGNKWRGFKDLTSQHTSFTLNYWQAGNYSTRRGGETISNFVRGIKDLISLITSIEKKVKHQNEIKTKSILVNFDGDESPESILKKIKDVDFINDLYKKLNDLHDKKISVIPNETYGTIHKNHCPEIIAVEGDSLVLENKTGEWDGKKNDLLATEDIPPEKIVARISFEQGHKISTAWDIIREEIKNLNPDAVKKLNINEKIVSAYGEDIEDFQNALRIFQKRRQEKDL